MAAILALAILALFCTPSPAQATPAPLPDAALQRTIQTVAAGHHGRVALYAEQLNTGRTVALDPDLPVQTASTIKLTILYEAMQQVRAGTARWDEPITLAPGDAVPGSGILLMLDAPLRLTLKDVLTLMIDMSDNTATNLAIDRFGIDAVNARTASLRLTSTHLYKKVMKPATGPMPADQPKFGLGKTTAREMAIVLERITRCQLSAAPPTAADLALCAVPMKMLRNQFYRDTIPRYLESLDHTASGTGTATKTGSLDAVRADVAILAAKSGPIVLSIYTYQNKDHGWTADNEGELTIARLARAIVDAWSPQGLDGITLVPSLGLPPAGLPAPVSSIPPPSASN
jgi:beta-lactamase class A